jgi:hypothetical protein
MDREDFIDQLRQQFANGIFEAYLECEHEHGEVDYPALKSNLERIEKAAKVEGLPPKDFHELIFGVLPHDVVVQLFPEEFVSKAS